MPELRHMTNPNDEVLARSIALSPAQRIAVIPMSLALVALTPWIGWWVLLPLALTLAQFAAFKDRRVQERYGVITSYLAWGLGTLGVSGIALLADGRVYYMAPVIAIPSVLAAAVFPVRQIPWIALTTSGAVILVGWRADPTAFRADLAPIVITGALLGSIIIMAGMARRAETDSFLESRVDPLTGAHNRLALDEHLETLPASAFPKPWTLILGDIDHFKALNDRYGHAAGDRALREVADYLRAHLPKNARLYRFGGEEFLISMMDCDPAVARRHADRMRAGVASLDVGGPRITMSFGVATNPATDAGRFDALFARADQAMYQAKEAGRNTVVVAPALLTGIGENGAMANAHAQKRRVESTVEQRSSLMRAGAEREHMVDLMTRQYRASRLWDLLIIAPLMLFVDRIGYLSAILGLLALLVFRTAQANLHRLQRPELLFVPAWIVTQCIIASAVMVGDGNDPWAIFTLSFLVIATAPAIPWSLMLWGFVISGVLMVATAIRVTPDVLTSAPQVVVASLALLLASAVMGRELGRRIMAMRRASLHDRLTGLPNRNAFNRGIADDIAAAEQRGGFVSLIMCDIDHFKQVNDQLGHSRGDAVLVTTASRLQSRLRQNSVLHRVGGEEFAILLPGVHEDVAVEIATRLRAAIAEGPVSGVPLTMSFGVATGDGHSDPDVLYNAADQALYHAKRAGRNRVERSSVVEHVPQVIPVRRVGVPTR